MLPYSEYISKVNRSDDDATDTLEFTLLKKYIFKPELSNGLTGEEEVTTLHPGIICIANKNNIGKSIHFKYSFIFDTKQMFFCMQSKHISIASQI